MRRYPHNRHVCQTCDEFGGNYCVYLLDENLSPNPVGLILENYVELVIPSIT